MRNTITVALLGISLYLSTVHGQGICRCQVTSYQRQQCAGLPFNVDMKRCTDAGCCFDSVYRRIHFFRYAPRCYHADGICPTRKCAVNRNERRNCGNYYLHACSRQGCCYDGRTYPYCYYPASIPTVVQNTLLPPSVVALSAKWDTWGQWSACSASCTRGRRSRERRCISRGAIVDVKYCGARFNKVYQTCHTNYCRSWSNWGNYGSCSVTCGRGIIRQTRQCIDFEERGSRSCYNRELPCTAPSCPPDTQWNVWGQWTLCSTSCTPGVRYRARSCLRFGSVVATSQCTSNSNNPAAVTRESTQVETCNTDMCGLWGEWIVTQRCPVTCGERNAFVMSSRICLNGTLIQTPEQRLNHQNCALKRSLCNLPPCPITARFVAPTTVTSPTTTVTSPPPPPTTTKTTTTTTTSSATSSLPLVFQVWNTWSSCSDECGPGVQVRFKTCLDRSGNDVSDDPQLCSDVRETKNCNTEICSRWGAWGPLECEEKCKTPDQSYVQSTQVMTRTCLDGNEDKGSMRCYNRSQPCIRFCSTTSQTPPTTPASSPPPSPASGSWGSWSSWSNCSESCSPGIRSRIMECIASNCDNFTPKTETEQCNTGLCDSWNGWTVSPCSATCGESTRKLARSCLGNGDLGDDLCYQQTRPCPLAPPCPRNVIADDDTDFLFLVDSSTNLDNCDEIKTIVGGAPVTSQFTNNNSTPNYYRIKEFMKNFTRGWKSFDRSDSRIAIQLVSEQCKTVAGTNLNLVRNFTDDSTQIEADINDLSYLCGSFWLDWALRCSLANSLPPPAAARPNVTLVVVALLGYVPPLSRPSEALLTTLQTLFKNRGIPIITASATPSGEPSDLGWTKHREMLTTLSCGKYNKSNCPLFIGSIWDQNRGTPAERIRNALRNFV